MSLKTKTNKKFFKNTKIKDNFRLCFFKNSPCPSILRWKHTTTILHLMTSLLFFHQEYKIYINNYLTINWIQYLFSKLLPLKIGHTLLSRFSRVRLCATPQTAAHQAPLSLGFSRQAHWSGLPFPSPMHESKK